MLFKRSCCTREPYTKITAACFLQAKISISGESHTAFSKKNCAFAGTLGFNDNSKNKTFFFSSQVWEGGVPVAFPPSILLHYNLKCSFIRNTAQIFSYPLVMAVERHVNLTRVQHSLLFLNLEYFILGSFATLKHNESQAANYLRGNKTLNYTQMLSCTKRTIISQNHCQIKVPIWKLSHICVWCSCSCLTAHKFCFPLSDCYSNDIKEQLQQNDNNQSVKSSNCRRSVLI